MFKSTDLSPAVGGRLARGLALVAACGALVGPAIASAAAEERSTEAAFFLVQGLGADQYGVDHAGNLWAWIPERGRVELVDPAGTLLPGFDLETARALDADAEWGLVAISQGGGSLELVTRGERREIRLSDDVADVAWLSRQQVAVSTTQAADAVHVVDLASGTVVRRLWPSPAIEPQPGATLLRSVRLQASPGEGRLYALDSLGGELRGFSASDDPLLRVQVPFAGHPGLADWARETDQAAKARGATQAQLVTVLDLAVDDDGSVWVVTTCDERRREATAFRVDPATGTATAHELTLRSGCCSRRMTIWRHRFVFTHVDDGQHVVCAQERNPPP